MKKSELPQDTGALGKITGEVCYVLNEDGTYTRALSKGWEVKEAALHITWQDIETRIAEAKILVEQGKQSPIYYFMVKRLMDPSIVSAYTGIWAWRVKRHLKPRPFKHLNDKTLAKYAAAFNITVAQLQNLEDNE